MVNWKRLRLFFFLATIVITSAGIAFAGEYNRNIPALVTCQWGRFTEFALGGDGRVWLFPEAYNEPVRVWAGGKWTKAGNIRPEGRVRHLIKQAPGKWLLLSQISQSEVILYQFDGKNLTRLARVRGKFEKPTLHLSSDGVVWILSREGVAYGVRGKERFIHDFGPGVRKGRSYTYYPPTLGLEVPGQGTWFWSHVEHEALNFGGGKKLAIEGFQVYQKGRWRKVPLSVGKLGGVALGRDGKIIYGGRYKGFESLSPGDETQSALSWNLPPGENCLFLHAMPNGKLLAITARPSLFMRLPPQKGGWRGTLLTIDAVGNVRVLLDGVDFGKVYHDTGRPVVDTDKGTFFAAGNSGLVFVPGDGNEARRVDWKNGIPVPNIERMRLGGNLLYILDRERGFAILDWHKLLKQPQAKEQKEWELHIASGEPRMGPDGSVWMLTAGIPGELRRYDGLSWTSFSLEGSKFPSKSLWYVTFDTQGRVWLISNFETHRTAILEKGKWRTFKLRETAYSTIAGEEKGKLGFRIGTPWDYCFPALAGDGRIAYQNEWSRISFFDGVEWDYGYGSRKIVGHSPQGPPFYYEGVLTVKAGDNFYQWREGKWKAARGTIKSPYGEEARQRKRIELPPSFPGNARQASIRLRDNTGTIWAGRPGELYRGLDDTWVRFPTLGTPITMARSISGIIVDKSGNIWFGVSGGNYCRVAIYRPSSEPPALVWAEKPLQETNTGNLKMKVRSIPEEKGLILKYKVDGRPWQVIPSRQGTYSIQLQYLPDGEHICKVRAYDGLFRASNTLSHLFRVNRDYESELAVTVPLLASPDYEKREEAARALVSMGKPALPVLKKKIKSMDAGVAWWTKAVIQEIEREKPRTASAGTATLFDEVRDRGLQTAIKQYEEMLTSGGELSPLRKLRLYERLVRLYGWNGYTQSHDKAIAVYRKMLEIAPHKAYYYDELANLYLQEGERDSAIAVWNRMVNITPAGLSLAAAGYLRNGMLKEAELAYHELVTKNPLNAYFLERLAMVYEKEQLYKKAAVYYEKALSLSDGYRKKERIKKALKRVHALSRARNH